MNEEERGKKRVITKGEGDPAVVLPPADYVLVGVRPEQIAQQTRVRYIYTQ